MLKTLQTGRMAELKEFDGALKVTIATNQGYKDKDTGDWVDKTEFLTHTTFREGQIDYIKKHAPVGSIVAVESSPYANRFETNDGETVYSTQFRIEQFDVIQKARKNKKEGA